MPQCPPLLFHILEEQRKDLLQEIKRKEDLMNQMKIKYRELRIGTWVHTMQSCPALCLRIRLGPVLLGGQARGKQGHIHGCLVCMNLPLLFFVFLHVLDYVLPLGPRFLRCCRPWGRFGGLSWVSVILVLYVYAYVERPTNVICSSIAHYP